MFPSGGLPEHGTMMISTITPPEIKPAQSGVEYTFNDHMFYQRQEDYEGLDHYSFVPLAGNVPMRPHQMQVHVGGNSPPELVVGPNSIYYKVSNTQQSSFLLSNSINDTNYTGIESPSHGIVVVDSNGYCTYTPTVDSQTGEPYYGWDFFKVRIERPGATAPLIQEIQLQVGEYAPLSTPRPESQWQPQNFPNDLAGLWQSYIQAKDKIVEVLNALSNQGSVINQIAQLKAAGASDASILSATDAAISALDSAQSKYDAYLNAYNTAQHAADQYMRDQWYTSQADWDVLSAIQKLPRDIAGLKPSEEQAQKINAALAAFGSGAGVMVENNTFVVNTAESLHSAAETALAVGGVTQLAFFGVRLLTEQGLAACARQAAVMVAASTAVNFASGQAVSLAQQYGVDPAYIVSATPTTSSHGGRRC
jgi:hypothetical protein